MLLKQTKIVATISDQRCDVDFIKQLFDAGMNVVRMNTAHLGREGAEKLINNVRSVSNRIAILMDTKGPEVRTTVLAEPIPFKAGDRVGVGCLVDSCRTCASCREGLEQYCNAGGMVMTYGSPDAHLPGQMTHGGYSTSIVVSERFVLKVADSLDKAAAAPIW